MDCNDRAVATVSRAFSFEASHILPEVGGGEDFLHGHTYHGTVTVAVPAEDDSNMPALLPRIDAIIHRYDHAFLASVKTQWPEEERICALLAEMELPVKVIGKRAPRPCDIPARTTCVAVAYDIAREVHAQVDNKVQVGVDLWEGQETHCAVCV